MKKSLGVCAFGLVLAAVFVACTPLVPYDTSNPDLYSSANSSRRTAEALNQQAAWQEQALTATAQAPIIRITETAAAVAVGETLAQSTNVAGAQTQAASWTQTAVWWTPTPNLTSTAAAAQLQAENQILANNVERNNLELRRQQILNQFYADAVAFSWVILVLVIAIVLIWISRRQRYQTMKVDARGNPLPILDIVDGEFTDVDRSPNYRGPVSRNTLIHFLIWFMEKRTGMKPLLPEITAERQDTVTHRDQLVDLATRGLPDPKQDVKRAKAGEMMARLGTASPQVQVVSPELVRPILEDVKPQIAQDSIEAELYDKREEGAQ